jgi:hypothetical protein
MEYPAFWAWHDRSRASRLAQDKELVLVAAEADGRVRLAHAENNDEGTCLCR